MPIAISLSSIPILMCGAPLPPDDMAVAPGDAPAIWSAEFPTFNRTSTFNETKWEEYRCFAWLPPPSWLLPTHTRAEPGYGWEGAPLQSPDGRELPRPAGEAGVTIRDVAHAGYKVVGDK